jgi:hypothetical protein
MPRILTQEELSRAVIVSEGKPRTPRKAAAGVKIEDVLDQVGQAIKHLVDLHVATQRMIDRQRSPGVETISDVLERLATIQLQVAATLSSLAEERIAPPATQNITVLHPRDDREITYEIVRDGYGNIVRVKRSIA